MLIKTLVINQKSPHKSGHVQLLHIGHGIGREGFHNLRINPGAVVTAQKAKPFAVSGKAVVVPPAAGHIACTGISYIERSEVYARLQVAVLFTCTELANDDGNTISDVFLIRLSMNLVISRVERVDLRLNSEVPPSCKAKL